MLEEAQLHSQQDLSSILPRLESDGCSAYVTTLHGSPDQAIVAEATADPGALVVMATHRSHLTRMGPGAALLPMVCLPRRWRRPTPRKETLT